MTGPFQQQSSAIPSTDFLPWINKPEIILIVRKHLKDIGLLVWMTHIPKGPA